MRSEIKFSDYPKHLIKPESLLEKHVYEGLIVKGVPPRYCGTLTGILYIRKTEKRFWSCVNKTDSCWLWTSTVNSSGVARFSIGQKQHQASRVSWLIHNGPFDLSLFMCHKCDNPRCVNPDHLFLGTHLDNMADMRAKGRSVNANALKTHCKHGHPLSGSNLRFKKGGRYCGECYRLSCEKRRMKKKAMLPPKDINEWSKYPFKLFVEVRHLHEEGFNFREISKMKGVNHGTISSMCNGDYVHYEKAYREQIPHQLEGMTK
jgi:hypothetical protein